MEPVSVIKLVRKYQGELESFGSLGFQIQVIRADGRGGEQAEIALLNEHQAALLLSLMRNSVRVVEFKVRLIAELTA